MADDPLLTAAQTAAHTSDHTPRPNTTDHLYDNPSLDPLQFLAAVMRDPECEIADRLAAAAALLPFYKPKPPFQPSVRPWHNYTRSGRAIPGDKDWTVTIRVGGMPEDNA
jgi:hypothetical protein